MIIKGRFYGGILKSLLPWEQIPDDVLADLKNSPITLDYKRTIGHVIQTWFDTESGWWCFKAEVSRIPPSYTGVSLHWEFTKSDTENPFKIRSISLINTPIDEHAIITSKRRTIK
jgi:hypothetical protein